MKPAEAVLIYKQHWRRKYKDGFKKRRKDAGKDQGNTGSDLSYRSQGY